MFARGGGIAEQFEDEHKIDKYTQLIREGRCPRRTKMCA